MYVLLLSFLSHKFFLYFKSLIFLIVFSSLNILKSEFGERKVKIGFVKWFWMKDIQGQ